MKRLTMPLLFHKTLDYQFLLKRQLRKFSGGFLKRLRLGVGKATSSETIVYHVASAKSSVHAASPVSIHVAFHTHIRTASLTIVLANPHPLD